MYNFIACFDDKVIFTTKIQRGNNLPSTISWDSLFTRHGFIVPYGIASFNLLDVLDDVKPPTPRINAHIAHLITPDARVYEFNYDSSGVAQNNRILFGKGFRHCRSGDYLVEESMTSAITLNQTPEKALEWYYKTLPTFSGSYMVMSIADIAKQVRERLK